MKVMVIDKSKLVIFLMLCSVCSTLAAQETDFGIWSSAEVSKKFQNGLKLSIEEDFRLRNDLRTIDKFESSIGLSYGLTTFLDAGISYSLINYFHPRDDYHEHNFFETRHRLNVFGEGECKLGRFDITLRERLQGTYRVLDSLSTAKTNPKYVLRSKLGASYNIKGLPLEPFAFLEFFNAIERGSNLEFKSYRWSTGLKYTYNKKLSVKLGYLFTSDVDSDEADRSNVLTIGLGYKL
jgi:opacity protein-like surface antigen